MTRHTFIAWAFSEGANLKGLAEYCGTSVQMIEQSYGSYIRKDFLGPLIAARPKTLGKAAVGEKPGPPTGPTLGVLGKRPEFPREFRWRLGELNRPLDSRPGTEKVLDSPAKSGTFTDFPDDRDHPKTAKKASIIPKNRTGSGRTKGNLGRDKFEVDALLVQGEGCKGRRR